MSITDTPRVIIATSGPGELPTKPKTPSLATFDADKTEVEKREDTVKCLRSFPFMTLPPELRLRVYDFIFEDCLDGAFHKETSDEFPKSGIRPRLSRRAALRRRIKALMAVFHTSRIVRAEGAGIAFQIAERYIKSTKTSLNQLGNDCKHYRRHPGSVYDQVERFASDCIFERYRKLLQCYTDLCVIHDGLRLVKENVSENCSRTETQE
jgi:hypothetical protein